jgi:hypothetical protein
VRVGESASIRCPHCHPENSVGLAPTYDGHTLRVVSHDRPSESAYSGLTSRLKQRSFSTSIS